MLMRGVARRRTGSFVSICTPASASASSRVFYVFLLRVPSGRDGCLIAAVSPTRSLVDIAFDSQQRRGGRLLCSFWRAPGAVGRAFGLCERAGFRATAVEVFGGRFLLLEGAAAMPTIRPGEIADGRTSRGCGKKRFVRYLDIVRRIPAAPGSICLRPARRGPPRCSLSATSRLQR